MRIPHIINKNTQITFEPSQETKELLNEVGRKLISENFRSDINEPPSLVALCIIAIAKNFENIPILDDFVLCADRDYLLEILSTNLPLPLIVPLIEDEVYWKRRYEDHYGIRSLHLHEGATWKCSYLERYLQVLIQAAHPESSDEEGMEGITTLLSTFIHKLTIKELQNWKPLLTAEETDIPDKYSIDHINLEPIFRRLQHLQEVEICYTISNVEKNFSYQMFDISLDDSRRLGEALCNLKILRSFKLHNSKFKDQHMQILIKYLLKINSIQVLDFSYCLIGDIGALCIAKLLTNQSNLKKLILAGNKIGEKGGEGLGFALCEENCCALTVLNLRQNPLGRVGLMGLFKALVRVQVIEDLNISGCKFDEFTAKRLGTVLLLQTALKNLDVTNNLLKGGEEEILSGVLANVSLRSADFRMTCISESTLNAINEKVFKNQNLKAQAQVSREKENRASNVEEANEVTKSGGAKRSPDSKIKKTVDPEDDDESHEGEEDS